MLDLRSIRLAVGAVFLACCLPSIRPDVASAGRGYLNSNLLIETGELAGHMGNAGLRLVDIRTPDEYEKGHLPGAINLAWQALDDLSANRQGLPISQARAEELFGGLGIGESTRVVAYDGPKTQFGAARLFFVLEFFGHDRVQVLNGGFTKWEKEGRPISTEIPTPLKAVFVARSRPELVATAEEVRKKLGDSTVHLLDARSADEYAGEDLRAKRGGRIPGAVNVDYLNTLRRDTRTFKSAEELRKLFEAAGVTPERETITYCQTGARGAHDYFALRLLGYSKVKIYDGSWAEWGNSETLPIEQ